VTQNELFVLGLVLILLFSQALFLFFDSSKRGQSKWLWGFLGLIHFPTPLIIYLIVVVFIDKKMTCPICDYAIPSSSSYCQYCGHKIDEEDRQKGIQTYHDNEINNR